MSLTDDVTFRRLSRARDLLAGSLDERVGLERAAREACLSPVYFQRTFARVFGETPHEFVTRLRMETAKRLLVADELPVTEVCLRVGYASLGTFSARFAARNGRRRNTGGSRGAWWRRSAGGGCIGFRRVTGAFENRPIGCWLPMSCR